MNRSIPLKYRELNEELIDRKNDCHKHINIDTYEKIANKYNIDIIKISIIKNDGNKINIILTDYGFKRLSKKDFDKLLGGKNEKNNN